MSTKIRQEFEKYRIIKIGKRISRRQYNNNNMVDSINLRQSVPKQDMNIIIKINVSMGLLTTSFAMDI